MLKFLLLLLFTAISGGIGYAIGFLGSDGSNSLVGVVFMGPFLLIGFIGSSIFLFRKRKR
ncbi:hypothetical protein IMZ31_24075 (plasmid) [Pontibacillus sp. ALD_SL1]|uniref:hypothetical protein n=1 Tax=Pontibacillus sp. ALD_SL1 TaxID=2777185 RepID=UPI001A9640F5|nr:hypothetical protein [Pontibacillus sp. ALD_SL1]QST02531.1 hypothetical protein IMZ31_24075 [Pontibacillus sp. ALD_SL1]